MKRYKRLLSLACTLVLVLSLMPLQAGAGENYDGVINVVDGTGTGNGWALEGDYIRIKENGAYLISGGGQAASNRICVNSSVTASVTLDNVNININLPFEVGKNSDVTMILKDGSTNILRSSAGHAAIRVFSTAKLTITTAGQSLGNGSLEAYGAGECTSHWASAGIGGSELEASGTIVIDGGTILAVGGNGRGPGTRRGQGGAGIGGAMGRSCGDITINGGNVTAYGGSGDPMGAGIGGGSSDSATYAGKITINGGTVRAYSGKGKTGDSALGTGIGFCSSVAISDNADVQAYSCGKFPAIHATAVGDDHSAYLLNFMLDARVTSDADMTIKQGDGSAESFNMTLPTVYKNFAATVKSGNDYTAALADGSKKVVSSVGENADFPGILDSLDAIFSSTDVKFVEVDTTPPVLTEGAVYRTSANAATVRFVSDLNGTYYYKVTDSAAAPDTADLSTWANGGVVTADAITVVTLSDMAFGPQHLHILAKSGAGNVSDVLTVSMPYDLYFFEDFEIYDGITNTNPVHHVPTHDGAGADEQKVISVTQADGTSGKVFRLQGTRNMISERRVDLPSEITAMVVYEADIKPISEEPGGIQLRGSSPGWDDAVIREALRGGKFYSWTGKNGISGFKYSEVDYNTDTWYKLRLEWDYLKKSFNYYVNDNWVGSDTLSANATDILNSFELTSGNSGGGDEVYFDNIKFYAYPAPKLTSVTAPAAMTLANEYASADAVISGGELPATVAVTAEDGTVTLPCVWSFPAGEYDAALGAGNTFRWTVNTFGYDVNNQTVSGSVIITNKAAPPVVDKPVISPDGGAFTGSQAVTLTCGTNGASVYYTTDGSEPSAASTLYAGAFTVFDTMTVKAIATKAGMTDSDVASATFTKNKLLSVTAPAAMTLANEYASADAIISGGELPATVAITAEDGAVTLLCVWSFPAGVYDAAPGAENSFRWTATTAGYDENGQIVSGDVIITNKAAPQPPAPPARGGSGGSTYVAPVSSGSDRMDAKAKISGNTAAVTMDESKLEQLLGDENAGDTLTLAVTPGRNIHTASVNANEFKKIAEAALDPNCPVKNMEIKLDTGTIQLDADALNSISLGDSKEPIEFHVENIPQEALTAEQRGALPKENEQDIIVRVTVSQGGKKIGTFGGGKVTILIPYVLKEGQNPEGVRVWYVAPDGSLVAVEATYDAGLGVARIVTDHLSEFIVRYDETLVWENLFTDVSSGDWFYGAIKFVSLNKLMYGVGDNLFDPHGSMTRGMIVTILHRLEGTPEAKTANPFDDVAANKYYSKAIIWAAENDIVSGYGNSKFGPDDHITREQIAAIFMNYARYKGYDISARAELGKFADAGKVSGWAIDAMSWAIAEALVKGDGVNLNPTANAERCQAAAIFQRFIENIK